MAFNLILTVKPTFKLMQRQNNKIQIYLKVFFIVLVDRSEFQGHKLVKFSL